MAAPKISGIFYGATFLDRFDRWTRLEISNSDTTGDAKGCYAGREDTRKD